jgi:hypothetical protein
MLLSVCPHTTIDVSSYYYIFVTLLNICHPQHRQRRIVERAEKVAADKKAEEERAAAEKKAAKKGGWF